MVRDRKTPYVVVVNQTFAQKMWGNLSAVGQHFIVSAHLTEVLVDSLDSELLPARAAATQEGRAVRFNVVRGPKGFRAENVLAL